MPTVSKRFGGKDIGLLSGRFRTARLQLTVIYVLILAAILALSSAIIYSAFSSQLEHRFRRLPPHLPPPIVEQFALNQQDVLADFTSSLLLVNSLLLVMIGVFSYWFAGRTLRPIQVSYNQQRQFLSDASHELRTPLAILHTDFENVLHQSRLSEDVREQYTSYTEEVDRMGRIVSDLLLLSRLDERAEEQEQRAYVALAPTIQHVIDRLRAIAEKQQISIDFQAPEKQIEAFANEPLLSHAIENVLKNAIGYTDAGGSVTVKLTSEQEYARIEIKDTGVGISKEHLAHLFDRFYRADASRSRISGGSGLGLAIVQSIMHRLHGSVSIASEVGVGTVVVLALRYVRTS